MSTNRPLSTLFFAALFLFLSVTASATSTEIDVLFAYTDDGLSVFPFMGDPARLESEIRAEIDEIHEEYEDYGIQIELRPHFVRTEWADEAIHTMPAMRIMLRNPTDGRLDDVAVARDAVSADLVVLLIRHTTTLDGVLGKAYENESLGLTSVPDLPVLEDYAFAVVRSRHYADGVFHHELQHLMGCDHSETDKPDRYGPILNANAQTVAGFRDPAIVWDVCASGCPFTDLPTALAAASDGAVINVGPGTFPGGLIVDGNVTVRGASVTRTFLDGAGAANVVSVHGGNVTLSHLTITGGDGVTGSGIFNTGGLTLDEVVVEGNTGFYGGAIFNLGTLAIERSHIKNNTFSLAAGFGGGLTNFTTLTLVDSRVELNQGYLGGGVHNSGGTTTALGGKIVQNTAKSIGGGFSNHNIGGVVSLSGVALHGNHSDTFRYEQCYDPAEPELCIELTPRRACVEQCLAESGSCKMACLNSPDPSACRSQCQTVLIACTDACPSS